MAGRKESTSPRSTETMELDWYGAVQVSRMRTAYTRSGREFPSRNDKSRASLRHAERERDAQSRDKMTRALDELRERLSPADIASAPQKSLPKSLLAPESPCLAPDGREWTSEEKEQFRKDARKEAAAAAQHIWGEEIDLDEFNERMAFARLRSGEEFWVPQATRKDGSFHNIFQNVALDKNGSQHLGLAENKERDRRQKRRKEEARQSAKKWFEASISASGRPGAGLEPPALVKQKPIDQCFESIGGSVNFRADSDLRALPDRKDYARDEAGKAMFLLQSAKRAPARKRKPAREEDEEDDDEEDEDERFYKKQRARELAIEAYHAPVAETLLEHQRQRALHPSTSPSTGSSVTVASSSTVALSESG
ncbi:hypothetical protein BST61_g6290 [Cercospora zeina]